MWVILIINLVVAIVVSYLSFKDRQEAFNLINASIVFMIFGLVMLIGAIPVLNDFEASSVLMFFAGLLIVIGIIMLIVGLISRAAKIINLTDIAVTLEIAAVCLVYLIHGVSLNIVNLIVPEATVILGLVLLFIAKKKILGYIRVSTICWLFSFVKRFN